MNSTQIYRKTKKGVLTNMYDHMRRRHPIEFTLSDFHKMFIEDKKYIRLYNEWVKNGYKKEFKPSLDRISNKGNYSSNNIHMLTWKENRYKQIMERRNRKGTVLQFKDGEIVARYKSQRETVKATGLNQGLVSEVLNGKRNHTGGFQFIYENPDLLK